MAKTRGQRSQVHYLDSSNESQPWDGKLKNTTSDPVPTSDASTVYKPIIDESTAGTTYIGFAVPGTATSAASWQIQRVVEASSITTVTYADGNANYDNVWDNRASLSYS